MVHGVIDFLLSDETEAVELRDKFIIKVVPMLNPDGVIHGNYRVSLLGVDLNRRWKKPSKFMHPTVYYTKQLINYFNKKCKQEGCESGGVVLCCDMHGHSRNMDLFMYACLDSISSNNLVMRSIPVGVDRHIPIFNMKNCNFALEKDK
jgi:cytosolic carboxypeptidase protein 2/3